MPSPHDPAHIRQLQNDIEVFLDSLEHPIIVEDEVELFDLTVAKWRLTVEFGKLLFEVWNPARSIARRVEEVAYHDRDRLGVFVRKPGARETATLEFRELARREGTARAGTRTNFRQKLTAMLAREFSDWRIERVSNRSDREHSFSAWYTRGMARRGRTAWAFLGLGDDETPAAADGALAFGLIWLDWLRALSEGVIVSGLKVFLPRDAVNLTAHRAAYLNRRALQVEVFEWQSGQERPRPVDLRDFGNVATHLVPRRQSERLLERHRNLIRDLLGELFDHVDVVPDPSDSFLSLRVLGLEVARIEGLIAPKIYFGLEGRHRPLEASHQEEAREFIRQVLEVRQARSKEPSHELYRLQTERWLENLLVGDITRIDPALLAEYVYPQVPAFAGSDRGVIDILSVTRRGRLAVIELKLHEEINLPLQALDYWLRVVWLHERRQFQAASYFPGLEISSDRPCLYLVSPAFRFHSTTGRLVRYLDPSIEVIQVGLNDKWREHVKILFRREMRSRD